jgi:hypothetical protein
VLKAEIYGGNKTYITHIKQTHTNYYSDFDYDTYVQTKISHYIRKRIATTLR